MKIYVAAPYISRDRVRTLVSQSSHEFTSSWLAARHTIHNGTVDTAPDMSDEYCYQHSEDDLNDIDRADVLFLFTSSYVSRWGFTLAQTTSGGRHVETGFAIAKGKPVVIIGQPENIFHRGLCVVVPDFETAIKEIRS